MLACTYHQQKKEKEKEMQDSYYKRKVYQFALILVDNFCDSKGWQVPMQVSDLCESDIADFAALLLGNPMTDYSFLSEDTGLVDLIRAALRSIDNEDNLILAEDIKKVTINNFYPEMEKIINEVHDEYVMNYCEANNIDQHRCEETGEIYYK